MRAKLILTQVRSKMSNMTKEIDFIKKQRDDLIAQLEEAQNGKT